MRTIFMGLAGTAMLLWTGAASAQDAFLDCASAEAYGWNQARYYVSAVYNKAKCNRAKATQYERSVFEILPLYWAAEVDVTNFDACLLSGDFNGWLDTIREEYQECSDRPAIGFDVIPRGMIGRVSGLLFAAFYWAEEIPSAVFSQAVIADSFQYDYSGWPLTGTQADCEVEIAIQTLGIPSDLVASLVGAVCR